jgi:ribosome-associated heat shock protein Hsp15
LRIDRLLWFLRFAKSRTRAQSIAEEGHVRINGKRVDKQHQKVSPGDILTLPLPEGVRIIQLIHLPDRRGPASEAQSCYRVLDETTNNLIAAANRNEA